MYLFQNMVFADMDLNQLEAFLVSQTKRREHPITEDQAQAFRKFWKNNKNKIHESIITKTKWNNSLQNVLWRIDLKAQAKNMEQMNESSAIMEFQINSAANVRLTLYLTFTRYIYRNVLYTYNPHYSRYF